jgi:hypothetical protein
LASAQLDTLWEGWMKDLSESYAKSLDLLEQDKPAEAKDQFRRGFVLTIKKLYSEAAQTYPVRFAKAECWTDWTKKLYITTRKAEDAFGKGDIDQARILLPELRRHFYDLHKGVGQQKSNDNIYAFLVMLDDEKLSTEKLKSALDAVENAELAIKAKAGTEAYTQAKTSWKQQVESVLSGGKLDKEQRDQLRVSTLALYKAYGIQFE